MPRLWTDTIDAHRREVREAIVETTATLVGEHGLANVTMARIAEETGIGRATLYKYFPDVEAILVAWHERHVEQHLQTLAAARDRTADPGERLKAVLAAYAQITFDRARGHRTDAHRHGSGRTRQRPQGDELRRDHERHSGEIASLVHRTEHVARVERRLIDLIRDVLAGAAIVGAVRSDVPAQELARFCLSALSAASGLTSRPAVDRLVAVTMGALRPASDPRRARAAAASARHRAPSSPRGSSRAG